MSAIINGKFYKDKKPEGIKNNDQFKAYRHEMQRLDHRKDLIQPRVNGKPNPEFIREYPENAKQYFSKEDIERYGND